MNNSLLSYSNSAFQFASGVQMQGYSNQGNVFYVRPKNGSDGQDGKSPQTAFKTLKAALGACVANQNDIVYMITESNTAANTTDYQATVLTWNKDSVHLIGVNAGQMLGQRARISNLSTATAIVDGLVVVSANDCLISGIEIFQGQGGTNPTGASIALTVSGQRNHFYNCQISGIGHTELDDATSRSLYITGSENYFEKCYIGLDTVIRGTAVAEIEILGTAGAPIARTIFDNCIINSYTSNTSFKALKTTYLDRFVVLKDCIISAVQNVTSAVTPTGAILNTTPNGTVNILGGGVFGYANISTVTDAAILLLSFAGLATHATLPGIAAGQQTT